MSFTFKNFYNWLSNKLNLRNGYALISSLAYHQNTYGISVARHQNFVYTGTGSIHLRRTSERVERNASLDTDLWRFDICASFKFSLEDPPRRRPGKRARCKPKKELDANPKKISMQTLKRAILRVDLLGLYLTIQTSDRNTFDKLLKEHRAEHLLTRGCVAPLCLRFE